MLFSTFFYYAHNLTVCKSWFHISLWTGILLKQLHSSEETFNSMVQVCIFSLNRVCDIQLVKNEYFAWLNNFALFSLSTEANKGWQEGHFHLVKDQEENEAEFEPVIRNFLSWCTFYNVHDILYVLQCAWYTNWK